MAVVPLDKIIAPGKGWQYLKTGISSGWLNTGD